jgi:hypothetical protein
LPAAALTILLAAPRDTQLLIDDCLTLAYSKEENAIVERMNKEVIDTFGR